MAYWFWLVDWWRQKSQFSQLVLVVCVFEEKRREGACRREEEVCELCSYCIDSSTALCVCSRASWLFQAVHSQVICGWMQPYWFLLGPVRGESMLTSCLHLNHFIIIISCILPGWTSGLIPSRGPFTSQLSAVTFSFMWIQSVGSVSSDNPTKNSAWLTFIFIKKQPDAGPRRVHLLHIQYWFSLTAAGWRLFVWGNFTLSTDENIACYKLNKTGQWPLTNLIDQLKRRSWFPLLSRVSSTVMKEVKGQDTLQEEKLLPDPDIFDSLSGHDFSETPFPRLFHRLSPETQIRLHTTPPPSYPDVSRGAW